MNNIDSSLASMIPVIATFLGLGAIIAAAFEGYLWIKRLLAQWKKK